MTPEEFLHRVREVVLDHQVCDQDECNMRYDIEDVVNEYEKDLTKE